MLSHMDCLLRLLQPTPMALAVLVGQWLCPCIHSAHNLHGGITLVLQHSEETAGALKHAKSHGLPVDAIAAKPYDH